MCTFYALIKVLPVNRLHRLVLNTYICVHSVMQHYCYFEYYTSYVLLRGIHACFAINLIETGVVIFCNASHLQEAFMGSSFF